MLKRRNHADRGADRARRRFCAGATAILAVAAMPTRASDALSLALYQSARDADSFATRDAAYGWLERMSRRLRYQISNPFYRCELLRLIHREATRSGIAPELVMGVIQIESSFDRYAVSDRGARGLMQLMPFWIKEIGHPTDDLFNPATNLRYGCRVLRNYLSRTNGELDRALGMYHGSVRTPHYANRVLDAMHSFEIS
ncbi:MAG: lytic transglycosylase domain-containing protein [Proteobacteria bacterium]|nr:MAG: lytic transglycosylase domain-containing protein [Pseudomonadota bacterium]